MLVQTLRVGPGCGRCIHVRASYVPDFSRKLILRKILVCVSVMREFEQYHRGRGNSMMPLEDRCHFLQLQSFCFLTCIWAQEDEEVVRLKIDG